MIYVEDIVQKSKKASEQLVSLSAEDKNRVLSLVAQKVAEYTADILEANKKDIGLAVQLGMKESLLDRLELNEGRLKSIISTVDEVLKLEDPIGRVLWSGENQQNGLRIRRVRVPMGVIAIIYESRPNVTLDAAMLCFKSSNACILKCGSESLNTSRVFANLFRDAIKDAGFEHLQDAVILLDLPSREELHRATESLLRQDKYVDLIIPRGSKRLIEMVMNNTTIPVFRHLDGNCHTYIHAKANPDQAIKILLNAKMRRVSVCSATESLLIDRQIALDILPKVVDALKGCEIRGDDEACHIDNRIKQATEDDYYTEYLDKILSVRVVGGISEAIRHINKYSSQHTESIITDDRVAADEFCKNIMSAVVMVNTSTQFCDGYEFGLGSEIGIATGKLHARGPVALEGLTTYKYIVESDYKIRP